MVLTLPISLIGEIKDISSRIDSIFEKFHIVLNLEKDNSAGSLNNLIIKVPNDIILYHN